MKTLADIVATAFMQSGVWVGIKLSQQDRLRLTEVIYKALAVIMVLSSFALVFAIMALTVRAIWRLF
jgi:hypothetical protein